MADREAFDVDVTTPGVLKALDAIGREHEVEIERTILQLNAVLSLFEVRGLLGREGKAELSERRRKGPAVFG